MLKNINDVIVRKKSGKNGPVGYVIRTSRVDKIKIL
tara:strand:+ start:60 stop:167 length:108 start_codon:yes stop_codon:yes gene_type:complete